IPVGPFSRRVEEGDRVTRRFGDKSQFAVEVGELRGEDPALRRVAAGAPDRWLRCDANTAFVPHFVGMLQSELGGLFRDPQDLSIGRPYPALSPADNHRRLRADAEAGDDVECLAYRFMDWGPTADNVAMHLFREGGTAFLPFSFWRED